MSDECGTAFDAHTREEIEGAGTGARILPTAALARVLMKDASIATISRAHAQLEELEVEGIIWMQEKSSSWVRGADRPLCPRLSGEGERLLPQAKLQLTLEEARRELARDRLASSAAGGTP